MTPPSATELATAAAGGDGSLLRALRFRGDEVQVGRVLHAVCQQPAVAHAFVLAVLHSAAANDRFGQRADALLTDLPSSVACTEQAHLFADLSRAMLRRRTQAVGAVDLLFAGDSGWKLLIELKINSGFGPSQRERYLAARQPLVAIVRDVQTVPPIEDERHDQANWLGAISWDSLLPALLDLPIEPAADRAQWLTLVGIMRGDGDFELRRPRIPEDAKRSAVVLGNVLEDALLALRESIIDEYGARARHLATAVAADEARAGRDGWAGGGIHFGDRNEPAIWVALRDVGSPAPSLRVWWYPPGGRSARRLLADAHRRLAAEFSAHPTGSFQRDARLDASAVRERGVEPVLREALSQVLCSIARNGALRADV